MDIVLVLDRLISLATAAADVAGHVAQVSQILKTVQATGRTSLTPAEWDMVKALDDQARDKLRAAIERAASSAPAG